MLYVLFTLLILFYMFFVIIKIRKRKIDELRRFLNDINYADLKTVLIRDNEKDR
ncbi:hypothetical protein [Proteiniborus sp.]|uniref:hypothetical protein n=1 Tax=Proteiniborus sp. TaxID=2079015 RepID=UPI0033173D65